MSLPRAHKNIVSVLICVLAVGGLFMSLAKYSKRSTKVGCKGVAYRAQRKVDHTALAEARMTRSFERAVSAAVRQTHAAGNPVARYDRSLGATYLEFPDGRKVYQP